MRLSVQIEFDKILDLETQSASVIVGRSPESDLVINHDSISRKHCRIDLKEGKFYITDLGSSNGVYLAGQRIASHQRFLYNPNTAFTLGKLECELSTANRGKEATRENVLSSNNVGEFTSTIRLARIDINREIKSTRELTIEPPRVRGPRNPTTAPLQEVEEEKTRRKWPIILLLIILGFVAFIYNEIN